MKKPVLSFMFLLITLAFLSGARSVYAQTSSSVKANVPFDFYVGDKPFQAGVINVRRVAPADSVLLISSANYRQHQTRQTISLESTRRSDKARLVFHRYGNRYYLAQVWMTGDSGRQFFKSRGERSLEREMRKLAKNTSQPEMVTIIASVE